MTQLNFQQQKHNPSEIQVHNILYLNLAAMHFSDLLATYNPARSLRQRNYNDTWIINCNIWDGCVSQSSAFMVTWHDSSHFIFRSAKSKNLELWQREIFEPDLLCMYANV